MRNEDVATGVGSQRTNGGDLGALVEPGRQK